MESRRVPLLEVCFIISIICQGAQIASAENIVFFFGLSSYSHRVPAWPIAEALAEKGHNITFVSPHPTKSPNPKIHDYVAPTLKAWHEKFGNSMNFFEERKKGRGWIGWAILPMLGTMMCEEIYKDEDYIKWVKSTKVDLVFLDALVNDCAYGMIHHWGAKVIQFSTSAPMSHFTTSYGSPDETSWIPSLELHYHAEMTFPQRIVNALVPIVWYYHRKYIYLPKLEQMNKDKLQLIDMPKFEEIERNTSLVFINSHYSEEFARSLPPNTIPIGGVAYLEKPKDLPKELAEFLKKSDEFIYMSFGSQADFLQMDESQQKAFIGAMRSFPQMKFVWKVDNLSLVDEFPAKNVFISKWMPQQQLLAHPKIRAFITHSGLLGIQEAIYNSVPLISFPIFAEQDYNAERIHRKEYGIRLEITTFAQAQLEDAIKKVLTDPKYRNNIKKVSKLFKERPQKPLDTALWWTDFVLRHSQEELTALRPSNVGQPWWVRRQLDVWATIIIAIITFMAAILYASYKLLKCLCGTKASTQYEMDKRKKAQ